MFYQISSVARQHVDNRNLHHRVAARLQAHGGASHVDEHLTCESRVVDTHVELQTLVLRLAADALAHKVHAVPHVAHVVDALHLEHMCLVRGEIRIGLDVLRHILQLGSLFQFHIYHTAMDALTQRNGHREGVLHTFLTTYAHASSYS